MVARWPGRLVTVGNHHTEQEPGSLCPIFEKPCSTRLSLQVTTGVEGIAPGGHDVLDNRVVPGNEAECSLFPLDRQFQISRLLAANGRELARSLANQTGRDLAWLVFIGASCFQSVLIGPTGRALDRAFIDLPGQPFGDLAVLSGSGDSFHFGHHLPRFIQSFPGQQ